MREVEVGDAIDRMVLQIAVAATSIRLAISDRTGSRGALLAADEKIEITETDRVHEHAGAAILRARNGSTDAPGYGSNLPLAAQQA